MELEEAFKDDSIQLHEAAFSEPEVCEEAFKDDSIKLCEPFRCEQEVTVQASQPKRRKRDVSL